MLLIWQPFSRAACSLGLPSMTTATRFERGVLHGLPDSAKYIARAQPHPCPAAPTAVFRAQTPGTQDGPRVWNNQLIR